jgi:hypothetical protein
MSGLAREVKRTRKPWIIQGMIVEWMSKGMRKLQQQRRKEGLQKTDE